VLEDVYVSDEHAEILPDDGGWSVRDLGSTNGTFLNGAKIHRPTPLAVGDQLRLGKTRVEVRR
jgi:pSer/pThr/pTyr-binding forkhead associated (FHA) protein